MQLDVKMFQDGNDLVVVFKNCTADTKAILEALIHPITEEPSNAVPVEEPEPVISFGRYQNMTPSEILETDGDVGFANLEYLLTKRKISGADESRVILILGEYLKRKVSGILDPFEYAGSVTDKEVIDFFNYFSEEFTGENKEMCCRSTGALTFDTFFKESSIDIKRSAMAEIITDMKKRLLPR